MTEPRYCPRCHSALADDSPAGLCPNCLMQLALEPSTDFLPQFQEAETLNPSKALTLKSIPEEKRRFGDYELLQEIARGGMGIVYKARQLSLNRIVALKLMLPGLLRSEADSQRFLVEAEAVAHLQHPNIVAIHEVGELDGQLYFSMEYVEGESLSAKIKNHPLPAATAANYVKTVSEAINYAHEQGILHRDLKPSNVLAEKSGRLRVTDFGLAKRIESDSQLTATGAVLGTPSYMPPEQAEGKNNQLGPASDVYSLGAMLYEFLTGRPPFQAATPLDTLLLALNSDPAPPRLLNPSISRDLETICLKCLDKDARKRYSTAKDLADDLGRYLNHEPIKSRPINLLNRAWRWCRRNPWPTVAAMALALLVIVILVSAISSRERLRQLLIEQARTERAAGRRARALDLLAEAARIKRAPELRQEAIQTISSPGIRHRFQIPIHLYGIGRSFYISPDSKLLALEYDCRVLNVKQEKVNSSVKDQQESSDDRTDLKFRVGIWEMAGNLSKIVNDSPVWKKTISVDHPQLHRSSDIKEPEDVDKRLISKSADGRILVITPFNSRYTTSLEVWDASEGRSIGPLPEEYGENIEILLNADGRIIALQDHTKPNIIQLWDVTGSGLKKRQIVLSANAEAYLRPGGLSPDGSMLAAFAAVGKKGGVWIWDTSTGAEITRLPGNHTPVWGGDGNLLATWGTSASGNNLTPTPSDENLQRMDDLGCGNKISGFVCTESGPMSLGISVERSVVNVWEILNPTSTYLLSDQVDMLSFNNNRNQLAANGVIWYVDAGSGVNRLSLSQQFQGRRGLFNRSNQLWLLPASNYLEFPISIKQAAPDEREIILKPSDYSGLNVTKKNDGEFYSRAHDFSISPDGKSVLATCQLFSKNSRGYSTDGDSTLELWNTDTQELRAIWHEENTHHSFTCARFSPDGKRVATCGNITIWDTGEGKKLQPKIEGMNALTLAFSADSKRVYFGGYGDSNSHEGYIVAVDSETGRELGRWKAHQGNITSLAVSLDNKWLASGGEDETIRVWDVNTRNELYSWAAHTSRVTALAFSSDNQTLTSGSEDGALKIWSLGFIDRELRTIGLTLDRFTTSESQSLAMICSLLIIMGTILTYVPLIAEKCKFKINLKLPVWLEIIGESSSDAGLFLLLYLFIEDSYVHLFSAIFFLSIAIFKIRRITKGYRKKRLLITGASS